jgi:hypothetical protein
MSTTDSKPTGLSPEARTLLSVLRGDTVDGCNDFLPDGSFRWDFFLELARRNHVALEVYRRRSHPALREMPVSTANSLRQIYLGMMQHGLRLATLWRDVAVVLDQRGLRAMAYKGRALAAELYGDPAARHAWDIDLMFESPKDALAAYEALRNRGFALRNPEQIERLDELLQRDCELTLTHEDSGAALELHWRLLPAAFGQLGDALFLWEGATQREVDGGPSWVATPEATLRMLLIHAGIKHDWAELRYVMDVVRWLRQYPQGEIERMADSIPGAQRRAKAAAGLLLAVRLLDSHGAFGDIDRVIDDPKVRAHAGLAMGRMFGGQPRLPLPSEWREFVSELSPERETGHSPFVRYLVALLTPEFPDYLAAERVPRLFRSVSIAIRAWRLTTKLGKLNGTASTAKGEVDRTSAV